MTPFFLANLPETKKATGKQDRMQADNPLKINEFQNTIESLTGHTILPM
jgi:hypothetical protein